MGRREPLVILLVEDDPNDVLLMERAFERAGLNLPVHVCTDGADAMAYLKGEGRYANRDLFPFPRALITDLKMPRCSGFDLLEWLDNHPECSLIPIIVLTSSAHKEDVTRAYQLGANCYFLKPTKFEDLVELVKKVSDFWYTSLIPPLPTGC